MCIVIIFVLGLVGLMIIETAHEMGWIKIGGEDRTIFASRAADNASPRASVDMVGSSYPTATAVYMWQQLQ